MSIRPQYFDYLQHFGATRRLMEFHRDASDGIALRHDIDHCIDTALEMAYWEYDAGISATYFVLPGAVYWSDPRLLDKCFQLQSLGHEVGVHLNFITEWIATGVSPESGLASTLHDFRSRGIDVRGTSAHGDRACYEHRFINNWIYRELRGDTPEVTESGLNAEGIPEALPEKQITYPSGHELSVLGRTLPLWTVSMADHGIEYEASKLDFDAYFSDTGGHWLRTEDPLSRDLSSGRVQVLMHPIHWKGPQRVYFFLSTARSGSKWLSNILDQASSCVGAHEQTLNDVRGAEKKTGLGFREFSRNGFAIRETLSAARERVDSIKHDYAECNVYLPVVMDQLRSSFPEGRYVHVQRNPAAVVSSIRARGWYDVPEDSAHPDFTVKAWQGAGTFERCCIYVAETNRMLARNCEETVEFESLSSDMRALESLFRRLGIAFYPELAKPLFDKPLNVLNPDLRKGDSHWTDLEQAIFSKTIGDSALTCSSSGGAPDVAQSKGGHFGWRRWFSRLTGRADSLRALKSANTPAKVASAAFCSNCEVAVDKMAVFKASVTDDRHCHVLLFGGAWAGLERGRGLALDPMCYYTLELDYGLVGGADVSVFCLMYDDKGVLSNKRFLGKLVPGSTNMSFSFAGLGNARRFNIALYLPSQAAEREVAIGGYTLVERPRYGGH